METVMAGSCVQVQCTFGDFSKGFYSIYRTGGACLWFQFACFHKTLTNLQIFQIVYIAPCVKSRRMSQILVFNNASALNWGHAKCIHFTGIYSMSSIKTGWEVHNDIQLLSKKGDKNVLLSATAIWQKKRQKRCSALRVSCLINMESLWLNTSREGGCCLIPMSSSDGKRKWRRDSQYS